MIRLASLLIIAAISSISLGFGQGPLDRADERIEKFRKGEITLSLKTDDGASLELGKSIMIEQTRHEFLFGSNLFALDSLHTPEQNRLYRERFADLFNFATLPFYWWTYERERGKTAEDKIRRMLEFCGANQITPKGHPLAWNFADPRWLPADPEQALQLQMERIEQIVSSFAGKINIWDVVNEATRYEREETLERSPILTRMISQEGRTDFLRQAFQRARASNPTARLLINDYWTGPEYAHEVIDVLQDGDGRPLFDVIGIQSHQHRGAWSIDKTWEVLERFASYGKPIHFTETTFLSGEPGWELRKSRPDFQWESTPEGEARQAEEVRRFYRLLFSHPSVEAITWWDFADQTSWQGAPAGLLREDLTAKPAFQVLHRLLKEQWWTQVETEISDESRVRFRGFYGDYRLSVETAQGTMTASFTLSKAGPDEISLTLK